MGKLNLLFAEIYGWCDLNELTLHTGKSEVMILQKNCFVGPLLPVRCRNTAIEYTSSTKCLGVVIDNRLLWKIQVNKIWKSYDNQIKLLKGMWHLSPKLLEEVYFKTIIPHVTFSISVWGSCSPATFAEIEGCQGSL